MEYISGDSMSLSNSGDLKSFIDEFNSKVEKKHCLRHYKGIPLSDEDIRKFANFGEHLDFHGALILLQSSNYDTNTTPFNLAAKLADAFVIATEKSAGNIIIDDCLPTVNLDKEHIEQMKEACPKLFTFCMHRNLFNH